MPMKISLRLYDRVCRKCRGRVFAVEVKRAGVKATLGRHFCYCGPRGPLMARGECRGCGRAFGYEFKGGRARRWCSRCTRSRGRMYSASYRRKKRAGA